MLPYVSSSFTNTSSQNTALHLYVFLHPLFILFFPLFISLTDIYFLLSLHNIYYNILRFSVIPLFFSYNFSKNYFVPLDVLYYSHLYIIYLHSSYPFFFSSVPSLICLFHLFSVLFLHFASLLLRFRSCYL